MSGAAYLKCPTCFFALLCSSLLFFALLCCDFVFSFLFKCFVVKKCRLAFMFTLPFLRNFIVSYVDMGKGVP